MGTVAVEPKLKATFETSFLSNDGEYKTVVVEKNFDLPDAIGEVAVNIIEDDGKTNKQVKRKFRRFVVESVEDVMSLLQNPETARMLIMSANYGYDLYARNAVKAPIAAEEEGPGRLIAKEAERLMESRKKIGRPITLERAIELVRASFEE